MLVHNRPDNKAGCYMILESTSGDAPVPDKSARVPDADGWAAVCWVLNVAGKPKNPACIGEMYAGDGGVTLTEQAFEPFNPSANCDIIYNDFVGISPEYKAIYVDGSESAKYARLAPASTPSREPRKLLMQSWVAV